QGAALTSWEVYLVVNQPIPTRRCPHCDQMVPFIELDRKLADHGDPPCPGSGATEWGRQPSWWRRRLAQVFPFLGTNERDRARRFIQLRGVVDPARSGRVHNMELYPGGTWFDMKAGVQPLPGSTSGEQAVQAVIGEGLARELGQDQGKASLEVGDVFELGARKWIVTG